MTLLTMQNLNLKINDEKPILKNINYQIKRGDFVILLGNNGSGKTSLLKLIQRQYVPSSGSIYLENKKIESYSESEYAKKIGILTQNCLESLFPSLTIFENYLLMQPNAKYKNRESLRNYLKSFNPTIAENLDASLHGLSGGQKQALSLAYCLLNSPELVLLDEHTSALDPKTNAHIMALTAKTLLQKKITCILTTHDLDIALNYGNRILILQDGKIHQTYEKNVNCHITKEILMAYYC